MTTKQHHRIQPTTLRSRRLLNHPLTTASTLFGDKTLRNSVGLFFQHEKHKGENGFVYARLVTESCGSYLLSSYMPRRKARLLREASPRAKAIPGVYHKRRVLRSATHPPRLQALTTNQPWYTTNTGDHTYSSQHPRSR